MSAESEEKKITFHYEKHPDYKVVYANGAYGGIGPRGEFKIDLFIEHTKIPDEVTYLLVPDGIGPPVNRKPETPPITREIQMGVIMTIGNAKSIVEWITRHINDYEKAHKEIKNER
ncbi:hypothetical protein LCGC14_2301630 [marine sediment metagenome]|uniref:Uncharacterized protein n=1 Tax=marine sediment metagenome TaxID=412755 RepID=A0A0F9F0R6_9ZZZZ